MIKQTKLTILTIWFALFFNPVIAGNDDPWKGEVIGAYDTDTLYILRGKIPIKVILAGIDAPEIDQPYEKETLKLVKTLAFGKEVTVKPISWSKQQDVTVAEVILEDGRLLSHELVKDGLAWWYEHYSNDSQISQIEEKARKENKGLWQEKDPTPPWIWRERQRNRSIRNLFSGNR